MNTNTIKELAVASKEVLDRLYRILETPDTAERHRQLIENGYQVAN